MKRNMAVILIVALMSSAATQAATLSEVIQGDHRSDENKARDSYRKPQQTLEFLGLKPDMTVVEIWPGGGWYSEILGPYLKDDGLFIAAQYDLNAPFGYQRRGLGSFMTKLGSKPDLYRDVKVTQFSLPYKAELAPTGSVDMVLTFRNVHNLVTEYNDHGKFVDLAFQAWFDALKPGGVLGVVDHEWDDPQTEDPLAKNGYISRQRVIEFARKAGFELAGASELLDNPKDSKDHQNGVWSLPPTLAVDDKDKTRMQSIGESDRFLLKFVKPKADK